MSAASESPAAPFSERSQQHEARLLGMWLFLANEIMLFGGMFVAFAVYRVGHADALRMASGELDLWLGGLNTAVLLTSSLFMALAVIAARTGARWRTVLHLTLTALLGVAFLGIKAVEYWHEYEAGLMPGAGPPFPLDAPAAEMFFNLYFAATGLHALHLLIGIIIVFVAALRAARQPANQMRGKAAGLEIVGLYWHLVDVIWVFLYPVLYLVGR